MKLHIMRASPYARIVRIVALEKGLTDRIEIVTAKTRIEDSPYYQINPSGRVPYLVRDDGVGVEESALICAYLDHLDGKPAFDPPAGDAGWEVRRLEALARSLLDGFAVFGRESRRPPGEQSPTILLHEEARARRMLQLWEHEIDNPVLRGPLNLAQITLACALGFTVYLPAFSWKADHPKLADWFEKISAIPSIAETTPPVRQ